VSDRRPTFKIDPRPAGSISLVIFTNDRPYEVMCKDKDDAMRVIHGLGAVERLNDGGAKRGP
jgi:hypothetical protein